MTGEGIAFAEQPGGTNLDFKNFSTIETALLVKHDYCNNGFIF
jgi:hypothetical protein